MRHPEVQLRAVGETLPRCLPWTHRVSVGPCAMRGCSPDPLPLCLVVLGASSRSWPVWDVVCLQCRGL